MDKDHSSHFSFGSISTHVYLAIKMHLDIDLSRCFFCSEKVF